MLDSPQTTANNSENSKNASRPPRFRQEGRLPEDEFKISRERLGKETLLAQLWLTATRHQSPIPVGSGIRRGANRLPNKSIAAEIMMATIATPKAFSSE